MIKVIDKIKKMKCERLISITGMKNALVGDNWHGETKHRDKALKNYGQFHLHGHIHSPNAGRSKKILDKQYDVGVDANDFYPVSISCIESWIARYKQDNPER